MTDLRDSKLTAAQLNVLVELNSTGKLPKGVRPRTIEILREGKFIDVTRIGEESPTYTLRIEGKKEIGIDVEDSVEASDREWADADRFFGEPVTVEAPTFHEKLTNDVAELEAVLHTNPWDEKPQEVVEPITTRGMLKDSALADWELELLNITRDQAERFDVSLDRKTNEFLGFGEVYKWDNPEVWNGLTAKEIAEDLATRVPANRKDKRAQKRFLGRQWRKLFSFRPRKALKLTGAKGL
jgi:hypothetical protein